MLVAVPDSGAAAKSSVGSKTLINRTTGMAIFTSYGSRFTHLSSVVLLTKEDHVFFAGCASNFPTTSFNFSTPTAFSGNASA